MKSCIFLCNGFEEGEAVNTIDILRRAEIEVDIISIYDDKLKIVGSHNINLNADFYIKDIKNYNVYDCLILPGGPGVKELLKNQKLKEIIIIANESNKYIAAICAAPMLLLEWKILKNHQIVHYPKIINYKNSIIKKSTIDKNIITGTSIGCSIDFALLIVESLINKQKRTEIEKSLVIR